MQKHDLESQLVKLSLEQKQTAEVKTPIVDLKKEKQVELPKPSEKKVSRYSERRNRTKERKITAQAEVTAEMGTEKETEGSTAAIAEELGDKAALHVDKNEALESEKKIDKIDEVKSNVEQEVIEHTSFDSNVQTEINE